MARYETLTTSFDKRIGTITIDRQEVRNTLNGQVLGEIKQALEEFRGDEGVGVVVFTGAGDKSFVAGAWTKDWQGLVQVRGAGTEGFPVTEDGHER